MKSFRISVFMLAMGLSLVASAGRGMGGFGGINNGNLNHGNLDNRGNYYHNGVGNYYPGNGWVAPAVIDGGDSVYINSDCQSVQECDSSGTCVTTQQCD